MNACHINKADDLVTPRPIIVEGFLEQIRMKRKEADKFVKKAKSVKGRLLNFSNESDLKSLFADNTIRDALISAAGVSEKARKHLRENELDEVLKTWQPIFSGKKEDFFEEVLYRYLLTKGGSLTGSMNNIIGKRAEEEFREIIIDALKARGIKPDPRKSKSGRINRLKWDNRIIFINIKPKFIDKNIDFIVLDVSYSHHQERDLLEMPEAYLACGELKGGIDPAGGDEHWKTARSAFDRIVERFEKEKPDCPKLFFVGAAIGISMAEEIFDMLDRKKDTRIKLACAANLTKADQVQDLAKWIVSL